MLTEFSEALAHEEATRLIARLSALKSEWLSEPSLPSLSPRTVEALMQHGEEIDRILQQATDWEELFTALLLLVSGCVTVFIPDIPIWFRATSLICVAMPALYSLIFAWRGLHSLLKNWKWIYAVYALTQAEDVRVLETLILATHYKWGRHPEIIKAINRLLDQVTETDMGLLSDRAQVKLWAIGITRMTLSPSHDPVVTTRVLRALAAVGNHATYTRLERYASRPPNFIDERPVIAVAQELLPVMKARLQRQQGSTTLLRASDVTAIQNHLLLRTVQTPVSEPPQELLRSPPITPKPTHSLL